MAIEGLRASLANRYTIERELGGGGMSRVFVANETALNRSIVIKVIAPELVDGMSVERFAREVRVAARLQHANIVPVLAAGDADGTPYYTMPFVRGESLRTRMASDERVSVAEAVHLLRDVARALAYAHGEGVVHRDIKPENILLSGGAAVVTDFGIAKAIDVARTQDGDHPGAANITLTQAGSSLGTPAYMAPEQAIGDPNVDHHADIYAWGLVAWELLAGRHPFAGKTSMQSLVAAQITEVPAPLATVRPDIGAPLSGLVEHCLEKDVARRPDSAGELLAALDHATTTADRPATIPPRRGHRRGLVLGSVAAIAMLAVATWLMRDRLVPGASGAAIDKSLAVIPFTVTGADTSTAYLGEGIADEVTNTLAQLPGLRLAGRSSSAHFSSRNATPETIGAALHVSTVLDGTVRRTGDQIRVTAELLNSRDGSVIWHENYQRAAQDVFAVQDDIARAIAGQLQVTLTDAGTRTAVGGGTPDAVAYDLYLKGMYLYRHRGPGIADAVANLDRATTRDSMFARAWAGLASALTVSPSYVDTRDGDVLPRAEVAARRAIRLDSLLSDGHLALGYVDAELCRWPEAEAELRRAIALDPSAGEPLYRLGYTLTNQGRLTAAIPVLRRAVAIDPLYFLPAAYLGWDEVGVGQFPEGINDIGRALALEPQSISAMSFMALALDRSGRRDSAVAYAHRILAISSQPGRIGVAAYVLARNGGRTEAEALARRLEATAPATWTRWTALTMAYAGLGDTAKALTALERAAQGDGDSFVLYGREFITGMPQTPRFLAVMKRFHLDPAAFTDAPPAKRP